MSLVALTVAGSDPSGGAGIQADLATFGVLGAYGTAVLTALTAQSTRGVSGVHAVPPAFVADQLRTVLDDVEVHAAKTGMLGEADVVRAVVQVLGGRPVPHLVVDPVMVATSGDRLLAEDAVVAVREELVPLADLLTPNLPEAAVLLGAEPARDLDEMAQQGRALLALGAGAVLVKGGHGSGQESVDVLVEPGRTVRLAAPRVRTRATHGTGCTLSAACAALRPRRDGWGETVRDAKAHLTRAVAEGALLGVGRAAAAGEGHGPVHTHAPWWDPVTGEPRDGTAGVAGAAEAAPVAVEEVPA